MLAGMHFGPAESPDPGRARPDKGAFSILFENDIFFNADHDYTNGIELSYTTAPDDTPRWAMDAARALPFFTDQGDVRTRYALGQTMFTPKTSRLPIRRLTDRPYAGFLFGAHGRGGRQTAPISTRCR